MADTTDSLIVIGEGRFAHPHFFEPRAIKVRGQERGAPNYEVQFLFMKGNEASMASLDECKKTCVHVARDRWPGRDIIKDAAEGFFKFPLKDGDKEADLFDRRNPADKGKRDYLRGTVFLPCRSKFAPEVVGPNKKEIRNEKEIYGGCYGYLQVNIKAYEGVDGGADGVKAYLQMVMKSRDGDKLGGASRSASDVFGGIKDVDSTEDVTAGLDDDIPF
jgi:hypothetical protein